MTNVLESLDGDFPVNVPEISTKALDLAERGRWKQSSAPRTGALLRTLAASKPGGRLIEVGGGIGAGSGWLLAGMDPAATLTVLEKHPKFAGICRDFLAGDPRAQVINADALDWLGNYAGPPFDLAFVDTTSAKFHHRDLVYAHLAPGAFFIADDLLPQEKWTPDHAGRVATFRREIMTEARLVPTMMDWAAGLFVGVYRG